MGRSHEVRNQITQLLGMFQIQPKRALTGGKLSKVDAHDDYERQTRPLTQVKTCGERTPSRCASTRHLLNHCEINQREDIPSDYPQGQSKYSLW